MAKKRTRKEKVEAERKAVNSQFTMTFEATGLKAKKVEKTIDTAKFNQVASIKTELKKSLIISFLILVSLVVLYWFSRS